MSPSRQVCLSGVSTLSGCSILSRLNHCPPPCPQRRLLFPYCPRGDLPESGHPVGPSRPGWAGCLELALLLRLHGTRGRVWARQAGSWHSHRWLGAASRRPTPQPHARWVLEGKEARPWSGQGAPTQLSQRAHLRQLPLTSEGPRGPRTEGWAGQPSQPAEQAFPLGGRGTWLFRPCSKWLQTLHTWAGPLQSRPVGRRLLPTPLGKRTRSTWPACPSWAGRERTCRVTRGPQHLQSQSPRLNEVKQAWRWHRALAGGRLALSKVSLPSMGSGFALSQLKAGPGC